MKSNRSRKLLRKLKQKDPFAIPGPDWPKEKEAAEIFANIVASKPSSQKAQTAADGELSAEYLKILILIATNTWRAKSKMLDSTTGEVREDIKRVGRHIEAIYRNLAELGIVIRDHTGDTYDEGQPMKVVASKPTQGLAIKRVSETLLPSIFWNSRLVQNGEIEIATPADPNTPVEPENDQP